MVVSDRLDIKWWLLIRIEFSKPVKHIECWNKEGTSKTTKNSMNLNENFRIQFCPFSDIEYWSRKKKKKKKAYNTDYHANQKTITLFHI